MILVEREPSNSTDLDAGNPTYKLREIIGNAIHGENVIRPHIYNFIRAIFR